MKNLPNKKGFLILTAAFILLTACGPKDNSEETGAVDPELPVITAEATVQSQTFTHINRDLLLDPAKTSDADSLLVSGYLYEGLVTVDPSGNIQPGIAQSWTVSDDELDYIFEIRPNARFSDGSQITVDVIADNFNRWFEPNSPLHGDGNFPSWLNRFLAFNGERDANNRGTGVCDPESRFAKQRRLRHEPKHHHLQRRVCHFCMDRRRHDSQPQSTILECGRRRRSQIHLEIG